MKKLSHLVVVLSLLAFSGCFKTRQEIAAEREEAEVRSNLQQNMVESHSNFERLQAEIGRLQGRIEELEHTRKKEMSGLSAGRDAEQKQIEELKTKLGSLQDGQNALFEEIKKLREDGIASTAAAPARPAPAVGGKKKSGTSYDAAIAAYKARSYEEAADGFRAYLEANPKGKHLLDARFFLGDSLYKQKNYTGAVAEFSVLHEKAPTSALGRRSTLRIAQSFKALGKNKDAKAFAQLLVDGSPDSEEAKSARKLLK